VSAPDPRALSEELDGNDSFRKKQKQETAAELAKKNQFHRIEGAHPRRNSRQPKVNWFKF